MGRCRPTTTVTSLEFALTFGGPATLAAALALGLLAAMRARGRLAKVAAVGALALVPLGLYATGMRYRPPPPPTMRALGPGIDYERIVVDGPAVVHVVRVDLRRPDLIPVATPPSEGRAVPAQRVRDFAVENDAAVAMNTAFFHPFHSNSPFDYYPRTGDPTEPFGLTMTDGVEFGANRFHKATVFLSEDEVGLERFDDARWAVTGRTVLVRDGQAQDADEKAIAPRSAIAYDGDHLWFVVADGRQPGYSEGMTLSALAQLLADKGAQWAIEMDGGGSSTLIDATDRPVRALNCPIHTRLPCRERPVAAQVGVRYAPR
jgi:hypothetical protein